MVAVGIAVVGCGDDSSGGGSTSSGADVGGDASNNASADGGGSGGSDSASTAGGDGGGTSFEGDPGELFDTTLCEYTDQTGAIWSFEYGAERVKAFSSNGCVEVEVESGVPVLIVVGDGTCSGGAEFQPTWESTGSGWWFNLGSPANNSAGSAPLIPFEGKLARLQLRDDPADAWRDVPLNNFDFRIPALPPLEGACPNCSGRTFFIDGQCGG